MDFDFTPEEEAFRAEVQAFIRENLPEGSGLEDMQEWQRKVREKRWVGFSWPKEVGGGGGTIAEQVILKEEMSKAKAPALGSCFMGLAWVGPSLIEHGTEEQKQRFIPDILDGKYHWCTGYSEPDSGSDLASLKCKAVLEDGEYVINGQKIWTSIAMWSKWMILLVRTSGDTTKHEGITCLLVPMDSDGLTVRPIKNMSGGTVFAEVFFDDVRVPEENRLGKEGEGWQVTVGALAHERSSIAEVTGLQRHLEALKDLARRCTKNGRPANEDPGIRRRIAQVDAKVEAMRLNGMRYLTKQLRGEPLSSETSVNKLHRADLEVEIGELALEIEGERGPLDGAATPDEGKWQRMALGWPRGRDRRRHPQHPAQHHRRADPGPAEGPLVRVVHLHDVERGALVVGEDGEAARRDVDRAVVELAAELLTLRDGRVAVGDGEVDAPVRRDRAHLLRPREDAAVHAVPDRDHAVGVRRLGVDLDLPAEELRVEVGGRVRLPREQLVPAERHGLVRDLRADVVGRPPEGDRCALGILEDRHRAGVGDHHRGHHDLATELDALLRRLLEVHDGHVGVPDGRHAARLHLLVHLAHARDRRVAAGEHGVVAALLVLLERVRPAEKRGVEAARLLGVLGHEIHPGERAGLVRVEIAPCRASVHPLLNSVHWRAWIG